jgi:hypothetical protein
MWAVRWERRGSTMLTKRPGFSAGIRTCQDMHALRPQGAVTRHQSADSWTTPNPAPGLCLEQQVIVSSISWPTLCGSENTHNYTDTQMGMGQNPIPL